MASNGLRVHECSVGVDPITQFISSMMQLNTVPDTLWKASLAWTVPCCSVFDWLVGHAGVGAS